MFGFDEKLDEELDEMLMVCEELAEVAEELELDTSYAVGLCEMNGEELESLQSQLEAAIEKGNQEALAKMGRCCMGFKWRKEGTGYRCEGGTHFVTEAELKAGKTS